MKLFNYVTDDGKELLVGKVIGHAAIAILILIVLFGSLGTIRAGYRGVRVQFNAVVGTVDSGLYMKIPLIQKIVKISTQTQVVSFDDKNSLGAASKDLQTVSLSVVLNYRLLDSKISDIYTKYSGANQYQVAVIEPILRDSIKATSAKYTAEELITKRADFVAEAERTLIEQFQSKTDLAVFERVNVVNIDFSTSFNKAIEEKVTAEQNALAAKNKLEQVKFEAEQRVASATAEAEAIKIQANAINSQGGADYVQLKAIEKWSGMLPQQMIPGSAVPFINLSN